MVRPLLLLVSTIAISTLTDVSEAAERWTLEQVVTLATERSPSVRRAQARVEAAERALAGAAAPFANPSLGVEAGPRVTSDGPALDLALTLQVPIDVGAVARRRRSQAAAALEAARASLAQAHVTARAAARVGLAALRAASERVQVAQDAIAVATAMERVARRRHEVGEASVLEPNFAALERADAQVALQEALAAEADARRLLGEALGLGSDELGSPAALPTPVWPRTLEPSGLAAALPDRPAQRAADGARSASEASVDVARAAGAPGVSAGLGWSREGDEAWIVSGGLQLGLPFQRNQLGVADASGDAAVAAVDAEAAAAAGSVALDSALRSWEAAAARHAIAVDEALPLARENLELVLKAYEAGKEELLAVLVVQRQALAARRSAIDAELAMHRAAAAIERAVGREVF